MLPFGAAAGFVHPATGYQLATALRLAPIVARVVSEHFMRPHADLVSSAIEQMWPERQRSAYRFYELGAATLGTLSPGMMEEFIGEFFHLPGRRWQRFMAGSMSATEIAETMWCIFARVPRSLRNTLLRRGTSVTTRYFAQKFN
jgi:lycopene beta-cyclase